MEIITRKLRAARQLVLAAVLAVSLLVPAAVWAEAPPVPAGLSAAAGPDGAVTVTWLTIDGVSYRLERSADGQAWAPLGESPTTPFIDPSAAPGVEYLYRLAAVSEAGEASEYAAINYRTAALAPKPEAAPAATPAPKAVPAPKFQDDPAGFANYYLAAFAGRVDAAAALVREYAATTIGPLLDSPAGQAIRPWLPHVAVGTAAIATIGIILFAPIIPRRQDYQSYIRSKYYEF